MHVRTQSNQRKLDSMIIVLSLSWHKISWPLSTDLNFSVYYKWGILEVKINTEQLRSLNSVKTSVLRDWDRFRLKMIHAAIEQWRKKLFLVIDIGGGWFYYNYFKDKFNPWCSYWCIYNIVLHVCKIVNFALVFCL